MADLEQLKRMRRKAHEAGDTEAAKRFTARIQNFTPDATEQVQQEEQGHLGHKIGAAIDGVAQGLTFGTSDEIAAGLDSGFGFLGDYDESLKNERARMAENKRLAGGYELAGQLTGAVTSGVGLSKLGLLASTRLAPQAGLKARTLAGAADGVIGGTLYGAGTGEDLKSRTNNAITGGLTGAAFGSALPAVGTTLKAVTTPALNAITARTRPGEFGTRKILERLDADGTSLEQVQKRMKNGLNLADIGGEGTRNLLKTTTNVPGKAQSRVTTRLALRAIQQGDRLRTAIKNTFADPDGYLTVKDNIASKAKELAKPLYDEAYANPVPFTRSLESVLNTPAGKNALRKALDIAKNEQKPFAQWFANVADDGTTTIKRVPDMRAWDYIKRGFDDVIDGQTDSITGKVSNSGRAVMGLKNRMLKELDEANPPYAEARKTWAGFAKMDEALEYGKKAMGDSPEKVRRMLANMSEAEQQSARIGFADALRKKLDKAGFTHSSPRKILNDREDLGRLRAMFKSPADFKEFRNALFAESKKQKTFDKVRGNSTTAKQLIDHMESGQLNTEAMGVASEVATGRLGALAQRVSGWIAQAGGITSEVADDISQKLLATNPQSVKKLFQDLSEIEARQIPAARKSALIRDMVTRAATNQTVRTFQPQHTPQ